MKIGYRVSSGAVLVAWIVEMRLPVPRHVQTGGFDPCYLWEQMPADEKLAVLVFFPALLVLLVQGLRNRPVPRWLAIAALVALGPVAKDLIRQQSLCGRQPNFGFYCWAGAVVLMCLHQMLQRPPNIAGNRTVRQAAGSIAKMQY